MQVVQLSLYPAEIYVNRQFKMSILQFFKSFLSYIEQYSSLFLHVNGNSVQVMRFCRKTLKEKSVFSRQSFQVWHPLNTRFARLRFRCSLARFASYRSIAIYRWYPYAICDSRRGREARQRSFFNQERTRSTTPPA